MYSGIAQDDKIVWLNSVLHDQETIGTVPVLPILVLVLLLVVIIIVVVLLIIVVPVSLHNIR